MQFLPNSTSLLYVSVILEAKDRKEGSNKVLHCWSVSHCRESHNALQAMSDNKIMGLQLVLALNQW